MDKIRTFYTRKGLDLVFQSSYDTGEKMEAQTDEAPLQALEMLKDLSELTQGVAGLELEAISSDSFLRKPALLPSCCFLLRASEETLRNPKIKVVDKDALLSTIMTGRRSGSRRQRKNRQ